MAIVETKLTDGILIVTLADEANRNALSSRLVSELNEALNDADSNPHVRVVVLTNKGRVFCAGADLSEHSSTSKYSSKPADLTRLFRRFGESPKPYVGRIAGHCVAGGMGLAAAMDISIATEDARFGFTEVRIGVAPAIISVICLPKMRSADAREAFLRGNRFTANEAARMGLINTSVPAADLDSTVNSVVTDLEAGGPLALAATKGLISKVPEMPTDEAFKWTGKLSGNLFRSEEAAEGMRAYLEKRSPTWNTKD